ncbi:MAG: hypothetical protein PHE06_03585 [Lachnospiraceae bacterium]|nr:hypothetical protein [Lachnospiraceae bacterium]
MYRWYQKQEDGSFVTFLMDEDGTMTYTADRVHYQMAPQSSELQILPYEEWEEDEFLYELQQYPEDTIETVLMEDGNSYFELWSDGEEGEQYRECYVIDTDTLRLLRYDVYEVRDLTETPISTLITTENPDFTIPEQFLKAAEENAEEAAEASAEENTEKAEEK